MSELFGYDNMTQSLTHYVRMESVGHSTWSDLNLLGQSLQLDFTLDYQNSKIPKIINKIQTRSKAAKDGKQMVLKPEESGITLTLNFPMGLSNWRDINTIVTVKLKVKRACEVKGEYSEFVLLDPSHTNFVIPDENRVVVNGDLSKVLLEHKSTFFRFW